MRVILFFCFIASLAYSEGKIQRRAPESHSLVDTVEKKQNSSYSIKFTVKRKWRPRAAAAGGGNKKHSRKYGDIEDYDAYDAIKRDRGDDTTEHPVVTHFVNHILSEIGHPASHESHEGGTTSESQEVEDPSQHPAVTNFVNHILSQIVATSASQEATSNEAATLLEDESADQTSSAKVAMQVAMHEAKKAAKQAALTAASAAKEATKEAAKEAATAAAKEIAKQIAREAAEKVVKNSLAKAISMAVDDAAAGNEETAQAIRVGSTVMDAIRGVAEEMLT